MQHRAIIFFVLLTVLFLNRAEAQTKRGLIDFNRDIRPVLSEFCFQCHGPDANQRKADLRLDTKQGALGNRDGSFAVVPGKPDESELYLRLIDADDDTRMPPPKTGRPLSPQHIALIKHWIGQGATWERHWSYLQPSRSKVSLFKETGFVRNAVDRFILAKLIENDLQPSQPAERFTLIRRLSFDLIGLPPTPDEVAAFVNDPSDRAYEKLVERLLRSPHYGERMAMHWLDLVRYADTNGYHFDNHRDIFPYRDYVIRAFNENKPFDEFTIEQLAGDLLPDPTLEQRVASGYNRLNMIATEGGVQPKEYLAKYATDRVSTTATIWLGATMACAECHDHKYDPYTMKDFYSFAAFFADLQEVGRYVIARTALPPQISVPTKKQTDELGRLNEQIARLTKIFETPTSSLNAAQAKWESQLQTEAASHRRQWMTTRPATIVSSGDVTFSVLEDRSVLTSGKNPVRDSYTVTVHTEQKQITGIRLEALTHPSLSVKSLSRGNGNFVLTGFEVEVTRADDGTPREVEIASAVADFSQKNFPIEQAIDGKSNTGWSVAGFLRRKNCKAVFTFEEPISGGPGTALTIHLKHESRFPRNTIGRFRLAITSADKPKISGKDGLPALVIESLSINPLKRSTKQRRAISTYYRTIAPELAVVRGQLAGVRKDRDALQKSLPQTLVSMKAAKPRVMRILSRGNWMDESGEIVSPAVPHFLPQIETGERLTRLDLARWLVSGSHSLTARVYVNRLWKQLFGRGLAATLDDLGSQGERPTHPQLLDYLAREFVNSGWDSKRMVKLMVMSATYRQSSQTDENLRKRDPYNRWLARQSRHRLDAELIRDNALAISGLLSREIGGRSVRPYQPESYWDNANTSVGDAGRPRYVQDHGKDLYRRGIYTYWKRTFLHPSLLVFDAPNRESCTVQRPRSNTPLQALVLLNDVQFVEAARVFGQRIIRNGGTDFSARLEFAYRCALSREPRPIDKQVLENLYRRQLSEYRLSPVAARKLIAVGESEVPNDIDAVELATWTVVARAILNLHETITRN